MLVEEALVDVAVTLNQLSCLFPASSVAGFLAVSITGLVVYSLASFVDILLAFYSLKLIQQFIQLSTLFLESIRN